MGTVDRDPRSTGPATWAPAAVAEVLAAVVPAARAALVAWAMAARVSGSPVASALVLPGASVWESRAAWASDHPVDLARDSAPDPEQAPMVRDFRRRRSAPRDSQRRSDRRTRRSTAPVTEPQPSRPSTRTGAEGQDAGHRTSPQTRPATQSGAKLSLTGAGELETWTTVLETARRPAILPWSDS
jgi:hypothetical protein